MQCPEIEETVFLPGCTPVFPPTPCPSDVSSSSPSLPPKNFWRSGHFAMAKSLSTRRLVKPYTLLSLCLLFFTAVFSFFLSLFASFFFFFQCNVRSSAPTPSSPPPLLFLVFFGLPVPLFVPSNDFFFFFGPCSRTKFRVVPAAHIFDLGLFDLWFCFLLSMQRTLTPQRATGFLPLILFFFPPLRFFAIRTPSRGAQLRARFFHPPPGPTRFCFPIRGSFFPDWPSLGLIAVPPVFFSFPPYASRRLSGGNPCAGGRRPVSPHPAFSPALGFVSRSAVTLRVHCPLLPFHTFLRPPSPFFDRNTKITVWLLPPWYSQAACSLFCSLVSFVFPLPAPCWFFPCNHKSLSS